MGNRRAELIELTHRFVDAFNRHDLDAVVSSFTPDAVYEDSSGGTHIGPQAIRKAFTPLLNGARGKIHFDPEDLFLEAETGKVMASWTLSFEIEGKRVKLRGLDLLHFEGDRLVKKLAYAKAKAPQLVE
jgi:ketosteroid isomerase-like protein